MNTRDKVNDFLQENFFIGHDEKLKLIELLADEIDSIHQKLDALLVAHAKMIEGKEGK